MSRESVAGREPVVCHEPAVPPATRIPDIGQRQNRPLLVLLVGISALGPVSLNGVLPANSAIMADLATRYGLVQLVLSVYLAASLVAQLLLGPLADRLGRRPVMLFSLGLFTCGGVLCAVASSIEWLLVGRFVQGYGGAACIFLPRAIVRDLFGRDRAASVIGYMTTAMMIAPMFGPAVGGWLTDQASWRWMYAGLALLGAMFLLLAWRLQRETRPDEAANPLSLRAATPALLRDRVFLSYAGMLMGSVGMYYSFLAGAPYVIMESRGYSASVYGGWFAMVAIGYLSGNLVAGRFSERIGVDRMVRCAAVPGVTAVLLYWLLSGWSHPLGLFLPMQLAAFCNGMSIPNMTSGAMSVNPRLAASASGIAGALQTGFGILLTLVLGFLLPFGDAWLYALVTLSAAIAAGFWWLGRDPRTRRRR